MIYVYFLYFIFTSTKFLSGVVPLVWQFTLEQFIENPVLLSLFNSEY